MTTIFKNYTPHVVRLNDGRVYESCGVVKVSATFTDFDENGVCHQTFGDIVDLPAKADGVKLIVSSVVLSAAKAKGLNRDDLVAPATGHKDTVREAGQVVSVPGFVD